MLVSVVVGAWSVPTYDSGSSSYSVMQLGVSPTTPNLRTIECECIEDHRSQNTSKRKERMSKTLLLKK